MHINKVEINGFKGIDQLEFNPKKINIILGRNNASKTSILEAIDLNLSSKDIIKSKHKLPKYINIYNIACLVTTITDKTSEHKLKIFKISETEGIIELKKTIKNVILDLSKLGTPPYNISVDNTKLENLDKYIDEKLVPEFISEILEFGVGIDLNNEKTIFFDYSEDETIQTKLVDVCHNIISNLIIEEKKKKTPPEFIKLVIRSRLMFPLHLYNKIKNNTMQADRGIYLLKNTLKLENLDLTNIEDRLLKVEQLIKEYNLIPNFERIIFFKNEFKEIWVKNGTTKKIPFEFLGDGLKGMIHLLFVIVSGKKILLLDEPDAHMHPGYIIELINTIIKFSKEFNIQFFITTHNFDLLDTIFDNEAITGENRTYIEQEINFVLLSKVDKFNELESLNYTDALKHKNDFILDLRGI